MTPATALLFDQPYVMVQWPVLAGRLPPPVPSGSKICAANPGLFMFIFYVYLVYWKNPSKKRVVCLAVMSRLSILLSTTLEFPSITYQTPALHFSYLYPLFTTSYSYNYSIPLSISSLDCLDTFCLTHFLSHLFSDTFSDTFSCLLGCAAIGMSGLCCPTPEGSILACCDGAPGGEKRMQDEWKSLMFLDHAGT